MAATRQHEAVDMAKVTEVLVKNLAKPQKNSERPSVNAASLRRLLRALDPEEQVLSNKGLDLMMEAAPDDAKAANGNLYIDAFVGWIFNCEFSQLPSAIPSIGEVCLFWSGQQTSTLEERRRTWLSGFTKQTDLDQISIKASLPPFNITELKESGRKLPNSVVQLNVPCYGSNISNAVMRIFDTDEMRELAKKLQVNIPPYVLSKAIQSKMFKVKDMINDGRKNEALAASSTASFDKLEEFVKAFEALGQSDISNWDDWERFVEKFCPKGWGGKLHFDDLLSNFGFSKEASETLRFMNYVWPDGEKNTYEQYAFRWLGKAFSAYGPLGCLTDVVNLVFGMMGMMPTGLKEHQIAKAVDDFNERVKSKDLSGLWIPNLFEMDAESDDTLTWLLLEHLHRLNGKALHVLVQLPEDPSVDCVAQKFDHLDNCTVFRDPRSKNIDAVKRNYGLK